MTILFSKALGLRRLPRGAFARPATRIMRLYSARCTLSQLTSYTAFRPPLIPTTSNPSVNRYRPFSSVATTTHDEDSSTSSTVGTTKTIPFLLADIGEGIAEVELMQWFVHPGDTVAQFDRVCEVQSDKATVEITSRYDGVVESLSGNVGDMLRVGSPILHISVASTDDGSSSSSDSSLPTAAPTTLHNVDDEQDKLSIPSVASKFSIKGDDSHAADNTPKTEKGKVLASPAVRRLGMEYDLDLSTIVGSGPNGRVLKADVLKLLRDSGRYKGDERLAQQQQQDNKGKDTSQSPTMDTSITVSSDQDVTVPIRGYNRLMVNSMTAALNIPQMVYADEINMNALRECREELQPLAKTQGIKLSFMPFCIKAASLAMKEYPAINSSLNAEEYTATYHGNHNIGVAIATERGLAVPVVKACQNLSILEIAKELNRLQQTALEGHLSESDITGATFTLSNIGAMGGTYMSPIVAPPQVAIGAMGKIQRLPRFVGDSNNVEEVYIMNISWGGDHRAIDGATMARFSNKWKGYMESPASMIFSLK